MLIRSVFILVSLGTFAHAEVCDRSVYNLTEAQEADQPIQQGPINFTYESGVIHHDDGARETVYCIKNDASAPVFVKWHGPNPKLLFESYATGGGRKADKVQKTYGDTEKTERKLEYGLTRGYGDEVEDQTFTVARADRATLYQAQLSPLDVLGVTLSEALADPVAFDAYMAAYQSAPEGGDEIVIYTYSRNWVPASVEVLQRLAQGEDTPEFEGPYFPVSYGVRTAININTKTATSSVRFWFGHFEVDIEGFAQAIQSEVRNRLSFISTRGSFEGLEALVETNRISLSDDTGFVGTDILNIQVGDGAAARIAPWTVGLAFDGVPISAMQGEVVDN